MNETSRQPPSDEVPPGDEPQPLSTEEQARIAKLAAEEALIREQLKRAALENEAAEREAKAWHTRYTFVPSPRVVLQAIGAGAVLVIAFFAFYQPLVDRIKFDAEEEAKIEKRRAEIQLLENQELSTLLDEQKKQLEVAKQQVLSQEKRYTAELKKTVERSKKTEENLNEAVQLAQKWKKQLQERTAEYEKLAKTSETDKNRFQQLARQDQERAAELARQLANLQIKAQTAKEQTAQVQKEVQTRPGYVFRDKLKGGGKGPEMIILAAGNFLMGSTQKVRGRFESEGPQHSVTISRPFALSTHEITFAEYDAFAKATGRQLPNDKGWDRDNSPVINVSLEDATAYAAWLSEQTGQQYRLPSEAEWEYACRAGSASKYSFGDDAIQLHEYAWYRENSEKKAHPVGQKKSNAWGLYDMHGNVWEWVEDDWHNDYEGAPHDGRAWIDEPRGAYPVIRGGGWDNGTLYCRSAIRSYGESGARGSNLGFRLARSVVLGP